MRRSYSRIHGGTIEPWRARAVRAVLLLVGLAGGLGAGPPVTPPVGGDAATPPLGGTSRPEVLADLRESLFPHGDPPPAAIRTTARVESAGHAVGTVETVATRSPVALRETLVLSGVRRVATFFRGTAWLEDANGHVRRAGADELATYRLAHALLFHTYLDATPEGFDLEVTPRALVLSPVGEGAPRTLELARDDHGRLLPLRWRERQQGADMTTTFGDWRLAGGLRFPYRSVQTSGDARFDLALVTTSLEFPDALAPDEITPPALESGTSDAAVVDRSLALAIPIQRVGALAAVEVTVEGEPGAEFLLDTGAGATVLSERLVRRLGLDVAGVVEARGAGGSEAAGFVRVGSLALPGVEIRDQTVVSLPLDALRTALERPIDGILGYDFFSRFVVRIDYARDVLSLFPNGSYRPPAGAERLPMRLAANVPRVEGVLDDEHRGSFVIDLGNATPLVLHTSFANRFGYADRAGEDTFPLSGIGGIERTRSVRVAHLALGAAVFDGIDAVIPVSGGGALSLDDSVGNVGAGLFADGVLVFDYDAESFWVLSATARSAPSR